MTRLTSTEIKCPKCNAWFNRIIPASINTVMDPEMIWDFIKNGIVLKCPYCNREFSYQKEIMIASMSGMVMINSGLDPEEKKKKLTEAGIMDAQGNMETMESRLIKAAEQRKKNPDLHPPPPPPIKPQTPYEWLKKSVNSPDAANQPDYAERKKIFEDLKKIFEKEPENTQENTHTDEKEDSKKEVRP